MCALATRIIALVSGSAGVGTTLITAHLGLALVRMTKCVVEIDTDVGKESLGAYMGVQDRFDADLVDVLDGRCSIRQALVKIERHTELYMLRLAQKPLVDVLKATDLMRVCNQLRGECEFILIDSGANHGHLDMMLSLADEFVLVAVPDSALLPASNQVVVRINDKRKPCCLIVNHAKPELNNRRQVRSLYQMSDSLNIPLVGVIEEADMTPTRDNMVSNNYEQLQIAKSCDDIARCLLGEQEPLYKRYGSGGRLWRRLVNKL